MLSTSALGALARLPVVAVSAVLAAAFVFAPRAFGQGPLRAGAAAEQRAAPAADRPAGDESAADEAFDLDIPLRRIAEEDFRASTEVTVADAAQALRVRVGAFVRGERVELLLRNVRGSVRFRASLGPVLRLLEGPRPAGGVQPPAAPSP